MERKKNNIRSSFTFCISSILSFCELFKAEVKKVLFIVQIRKTFIKLKINYKNENYFLIENFK